MAARNAVVWVLITDGVTARICSTEDGATAPILAPSFSVAGSDDESDWDNRLHRAWFSTASQRVFFGGRRQLALHLAQILHEGATERAFSGLILIAAPEIRDELQRALSVETQGLLIGNIIRDLPSFGEIEAGFSMELRH